MRRSIRTAAPQPAMLVALLALFLAAGGTGYAFTVSGTQIKDGTIRGKDLADRTIVGKKLGKQIIGPEHLNSGFLGSLTGIAKKGDPGPQGDPGLKGDPGQKGDQGSGATLPSGRMWIDHFSFLPGDPSVTTTHNAFSSGVGNGLTALVISSSTTGEDATGGGSKLVQRALEVPPGYKITGVRVCYELTNVRSFISHIRLAQVQSTPSSATVLLEDGTDLTSAGPACADSAPTSITAGDGPVLVDLRVKFGDVTDKIALRGVGLSLVPA